MVLMHKLNVKWQKVHKLGFVGIIGTLGDLKVKATDFKF